MTDARLPPGWPAQVRPPGSPQWERTASGWLFDHCPADYRGYPVLTRHPAALAHLTALHVDATLHATRQAAATARSQLSRTLAPPALADLLEALSVEEARLIAAARAVALVRQALAGQPYIPRL